MRILIVDDSRAMRLIVARTLRQAGFAGHEVIEAANGIEALEAVRSSDPHLILADWNMPEMDGMELLRAIRAAGNDVTFGFVTSWGSRDMQLAAMSEGADFLIAKPFTVDSFTEVLEPVFA